MGEVRLDDFIKTLSSADHAESENVRLDDALKTQRVPIDTDDFDIMSLLKIPESTINHWWSMGKITFSEHAQGVKLGKFVPFVGEGAEMIHSGKVMSAIHRIQANEYKENKVQRNKDMQLAQQYLLGIAEEQVRGYNMGGDVARGLAELPAFAGEFLMTMGVGTAVKKGVAKGVTKGLQTASSKMLRRALAHSAGFVAQAGVMISAQVGTRGVGGAYEREIGLNLVYTDKGLRFSDQGVRKPFTSLALSIGDITIEVASELAGEAFLGPMISKAGASVSKKFPKALHKAIQKAHIKMKGNPGVQKLFTQAGYNGFITEMGEERLGALVRAVTGVEDFGADDGNMFDRIWASIPNGYDLAVEAMVLSVPGVSQFSVSQMVNRIQKERQSSKEETEIEDSKPEPKVLSQEEVNVILDKVEAEEKTPEQRKTEVDKATTLDQVQETQAKQKAQEDKLSKEEIKRLAVEKTQDEKVLLKMRNLDAEVQGVDKKLSVLEKKRKVTLKQGTTTSDLEARNIEKEMDALLAHRDVLDSERGHILTTAKEKMDLEKENLEVKGATLTKIAMQGIKDSISALKKGRVLGAQLVKSVQAKALQVLQDSALDRADKGSFIKTIQNISTEKQLSTAIPKIEKRIEQLEEKAKRKELVRGIVKTSKGKIAPDYREQIDSILEDYDLKKRTQKTKQRREKRRDFLARVRESGEIDLPADFFDKLEATTLDEMSTDDLQMLHDQVTILKRLGATKGRLISEKNQRELDDVVEEVSINAHDAVNKEIKQPETGKVKDPVGGSEGKSWFAQVKDRASAYFTFHEKVGFIARTLGIRFATTDIIRRGQRKYWTERQRINEVLKKAYLRLGKDHKKITRKKMKVEGMRGEWTREDLIGIVLNSGNKGNRDRLVKGNGFTRAEIAAAQEALNGNEREFVKDIFNLLSSMFPDTIATTEKLYGVRPPAIVGDYFPIIADFKNDATAQEKQAKRDLFERVFQTTHMNRNFTYARRGGSAPVRLDVFQPLQNHIDDVLRYNTLAAEVRDVQKIINHPVFKGAIKDTLGEQIYNQFPSWLSDFANPRKMLAHNIVDKAFQSLRHNVTMAALSYNTVVSILQGGSYTLTTKEIGEKWAAVGMLDLFHKGSFDFVDSRSVYMANRTSSFGNDRDMRDFLRAKQIKHLMKGGRTTEETMFLGITFIDMLTTKATWLGAYKKSMSEHGNELKAIDYADDIVELTQPQGSTEHLAAVMRQGQVLKAFTMFTSFFSVMHNQLISTMNELKYSKSHPIRSYANFVRSMMYVWVLPSIMATFVRSLGGADKERYLKDLASYPFLGLLIARDIVGAAAGGFSNLSTPVLSGLEELFLKTSRCKDPQKKVKHGVKGVALLSGRIPTKLIEALDGGYDYFTGETTDLRRFFISEWGIGGGETKDKRSQSNIIKF